MNVAKLRAAFTITLLLAFSSPAFSSLLGPCATGLSNDNTIILEAKDRKADAPFRIGREDLSYLGDRLSFDKKDVEGNPRYPEIRREHAEWGLVAAGALKRWRHDKFSELVNMKEADFHRILRDAIDTHRADQQFTSQSRQGFLRAVESYLLAKESSLRAAEKKAEDVILRECIGKTEKIDGEEFQSLQADFRNMMTIADEAEFRAHIPRVAMPVILSAFLYRNFRTYPNPLLQGEGSMGAYVNQFMIPAQ